MGGVLCNHRRGVCCKRRDHEEMVKDWNFSGKGFEPLLDKHMEREKRDRSQSFARASSAPYHEAIATGFPPLLQMPGCKICTCLLFIAIFFGLCLTVFQDWLTEHKIPREVFLEYASIPFVSIIFTYVHIWAALYMTFYPLRYIGCLQIPGTNTGCGWQGIIPSKAEKMARTSVQLMTQNLINVHDIAKRIDADELYWELQNNGFLDQQLFECIHRAAEDADPDLWHSIPGAAKSMLLASAKADAQVVMASLVDDMRSNMETVFDLEEMVVGIFMKNPQLLNHMFIECGYDELVFIRDCGAWMGGAFGIVQVVLWFFYAKGWMLPAFGFAAGVLSNWLALKMIFEPVEPISFCGLQIQGLFLKRQKEVAKVYAAIVSEHVLHAKNIIKAILRGRLSENLFKLLLKHVDVASDRSVGAVGSLLRSREELNRVKFKVAEEMASRLPETMKHVESKIDKSMALQPLLEGKLAALSPQKFENLLHPVFQEDEWKLVLMGGVLGIVIGLCQWHVLGS